MNLLKLTAVELGQKIREGEISCVEALQEVFLQMNQREKILNCYITVDKEGAMERAHEVQRQIEKGRLSHPLAGVPAAVKDNINVRDMRTTCGSKILDEFRAPFSAQAVRNLEKAGVVIVGKTNMDEFGMGSTTETSAYGVTVNPWNTEFVPGGSSGGSAAAVASGECFFALGSDTGGSVRQPAAYCGMVGMKPTYGLVSRYGLVAYASSMDQIGVIARDVRDSAIIMETIASYDNKDATSVKRKNNALTEYAMHGIPQSDAKSFRIGILYQENPGQASDLEGIQSLEEAAKFLRERGAQTEAFALKSWKYALPAYYILAQAEASSNLARFDGVKYGYRTGQYDNLQELYEKTRTQGFGTEVKKRIMTGTFVLSAAYYDTYYHKALSIRNQIRKEMKEAFGKYDMILSLTAGTDVPRLGDSLKDTLGMYQKDENTVLANLAGLPGISIPWKQNKKGLPVSVQLMADSFQEARLIQAAAILESGRAFDNTEVIGRGKSI